MQVPHALETEEHSPAHIEAWILVELLHRNLDRDKFSKHLPYDVSSLMTGDATMFSPETCRTEFATLAAWFSYASGVLEEYASQANPTKASATLRIHPQDLSLEMQLPLAAVPSGAQHFIRAGFALGTRQAPDAHFYVGRSAELPDRTAPPDAVLRVSELPGGDAGRTAVLDFLRRSTDAVAAP